ncbi:MAG TPA: hypothetical protein P5205_01190 [Candidatus Paceibacterota bacterium]|nr:hypothetical protein [Verrucomicrobiota bacterium]HSA08964.1 hypothetical protein [Candidatus Paceibacterota bacterium]
MRRIPTETDSKAIAFSAKLFQRLLAAYPKAYRREYGQPMAQLFHDQCRDSWRTARELGLAWLWLRVLPDLVKTSVLEHISAFKERNTVLDRICSLLRLRSAPRSVFFAVFAVVFMLIVATSTLTTFLLPELYSSTVRIKPGWTVNDRAGQAEFEIVRSEPVLNKVIAVLDLNRTWGRKYARGASLDNSETLALLKPRIDLRPVRSTPLIEIRVFSEDRDEAAALANAIAWSYREYRSLSPLEIVDKGVPGLRPVRPNKPLNIAFGVVGGILLATVVGAGMAGLAAWMARKSRGAEASPETGASAPP